MNFSLKAKLPLVRLGKPTEGDGYVIVARDLLQGVETLSTLQNIPPRSCALIAAHALECALKAFLWHKGKKTEIHKPKVRHDLIALWTMAYKEGLSISAEPPDWCRILSEGHGPNYYFRYQEGEKGEIVHGGSTPAMIPMAAELKKLFELVDRTVKS